MVCEANIYTLATGVVSRTFCAVAMALNELEYRALGVRLDSGDLAYLSVVVRQFFKKMADT